MLSTLLLRLEKLPSLEALGLLLIFGLLLTSAWAKQQDMPNTESMPGMNHMDMSTSAAHETPEVLARRLANKQGSEFNHHLAGLLVFLAGVFVFADEHLAKRIRLVRYMWPICFLAAGVFILIFSDFDIWPFDPQTPWYAFTQNTEALQHKIFAVILLSLGYVELQRARGRFKEHWTALVFPVVAIAGAILLLFHVHGGDMTAPNAMETMEHIETQHHWFAVAGFGIAVTKGLAEIPQQWQHIFRRAWPALLTVLGILLMTYTE